MLPIATTSHVGAVKIQQGGALSVAADGTLSAQTRYGTYYKGHVSDYSQALFVGEWLALCDGVLGNNAANVATLRVAPSGRSGISFSVTVDDRSVGTITFGQGKVTGTFSLTTIALKAGAVVTIGVPNPDALAQETQASGLVLILVC